MIKLQGKEKGSKFDVCLQYLVTEGVINPNGEERVRENLETDATLVREHE